MGTFFFVAFFFVVMMLMGSDGINTRNFDRGKAAYPQLCSKPKDIQRSTSSSLVLRRLIFKSPVANLLSVSVFIYLFDGYTQHPWTVSYFRVSVVCTRDFLTCSPPCMMLLEVFGAAIQLFSMFVVVV